MNTPNDFIRGGAQSYVARIGLPRIVEGHYVGVSQALARIIAVEYDLLPVKEEGYAVKEAYKALSKEVLDQFFWVEYEMGINLEPWTKAGQPYQDSRQMMQDVRDNFHLYYFTGGEEHPALGHTNLAFRAVHDIFGHCAEGFAFGPRGEENAWIHHSMMFSPLAQRALTTETRGQNSWFNFGPHSHLPACDRPFADQKVALLPSWCWDWRATLFAQMHG